MNNIEHLQAKLHNSAFRHELKQNTNQCLRDFGIDVGDTEYKVVENTKDITYIAMPDAVNISTDELDNLQAAATAGSATTASTVGCICGSFSSASSLGTAGSAS